MLDRSKTLAGIAIAALALAIGLAVFSIAWERQPKAPCGQQPCSDSVTGGGAVAVLKNHFAEQGYFWAFVQSEELGGGKLRFTVSPGDVYRFDRLLVIGAADGWSKEALRTFPLRNGDIYRPSLVRAWLDGIERPTTPPSTSGYRLNRFTINTDRDKHTISLVLEVGSQADHTAARGQ